MALAVVVENGQPASLASGHSQVLPSIAIHIEPGHPWPELAQTARQQRLALEIVEGVLMMGMPEPVADVLEHRGRGRWGGGIDPALRYGLRPGIGRLENLIEAVGPGVGDGAAATAAPSHINAQPVCEAAGRKDALGLVAGQISAAAHHLLALGDRSAADRDAGADAGRVGWPAFEPHRHARGGRFVAVNPERAVEVVDDEVQVPIIVQVGQGHAVSDADLVKAPGRAALRERQVAAIAEGQFRLPERRQHEQFPGNLRGGIGSLGRDARLGIAILGVEHVTGAGQHVLEAIEVHIQEEDRPVPFAVVQPGIRGNFGIGAVASIPLQRRPVQLWAV